MNCSPFNTLRVSELKKPPMTELTSLSSIKSSSVTKVLSSWVQLNQKDHHFIWTYTSYLIMHYRDLSRSRNWVWSLTIPQLLPVPSTAQAGRRKSSHSWIHEWGYSDGFALHYIQHNSWNTLWCLVQSLTVENKRNCNIIN